MFNISTLTTCLPVVIMEPHLCLFTCLHTHTAGHSRGLLDPSLSNGAPLSSCMRSSQLSLPCRCDHDPLSASEPPWDVRRGGDRMEGEMKLSALRGEDWLLVRNSSTSVRAISHTEYEVRTRTLNAALTGGKKNTFCSKCPLHNLLAFLLPPFCFLPPSSIKMMEQGLDQVHQPRVAISVAPEHSS